MSITHVGDRVLLALVVVLAGTGASAGLAVTDAAGTTTADRTTGDIDDSPTENATRRLTFDIDDCSVTASIDVVTSLETIIGFYISHHTGSQLSLAIERPLADVTVTSW